MPITTFDGLGRSTVAFLCNISRVCRTRSAARLCEHPLVGLSHVVCEIIAAALVQAVHLLKGITATTAGSYLPEATPTQWQLKPGSSYCQSPAQKQMQMKNNSHENSRIIPPLGGSRTVVTSTRASSSEGAAITTKGTRQFVAGPTIPASICRTVQQQRQQL